MLQRHSRSRFCSCVWRQLDTIMRRRGVLSWHAFPLQLTWLSQLRMRGGAAGHDRLPGQDLRASGGQVHQRRGHRADHRRRASGAHRAVLPLLLLLPVLLLARGGCAGARGTREVPSPRGLGEPARRLGLTLALGAGQLVGGWAVFVALLSRSGCMAILIWVA